MPWQRSTLGLNLGQPYQPANLTIHAFPVIRDNPQLPLLEFSKRQPFLQLLASACMAIRRQCATISEATDCQDTVTACICFVFVCFTHLLLCESVWVCWYNFFWCVCVCVPDDVNGLGLGSGSRNVKFAGSV